MGSNTIVVSEILNYDVTPIEWNFQNYIYLLNYSNWQSPKKKSADQYF